VLLIGVWALGTSSAAAADDPGRLRIAHLSPDTPAVDVAVAAVPAGVEAPLRDPGPDLASDLAYGSLSDFAELPPGSYALSLRAAADDRTTPPALSTRIEVPAGGARTVAVTGRFADLSLQTLSDDLTAPPPDSARIRVLASAAGAEALDVTVAHGPVLAAALPFGAAGKSLVVPTGPGNVHIDGGSGRPIDLPVAFAAGSVLTLVVLDAPGGGLTARLVLDAAGPAAVPAGGVEAGSGDVTGGPAPLIAAAVLAAVLAASRRRGRAVLAVATVGLTVGALPPGPAPPAAAPFGTTLATGAPAAPTTWLEVPSAGVHSALASMDLDPAGELVAPEDPASAGWFTGGPAPGETGPAVIAGHVNWAAAPGVFARLDQVAVGDPVVVGRADGTMVRFTVTRVARHPKDAFPTAEVYGPTTGAELRLITCGGAFDRATGSYLDNVVVYAEEAG
jgi:hypothetical protein